MEEVHKLLNENQSTFADDPTVNNDDTSLKRKLRLLSVVVGGDSSKFFGKELSVSDIEALSTQERDALHVQYETKLGRDITQSLGSTIITLYAKLLGTSLNRIDLYGHKFQIDDEGKLISDLEKDPFINSMLNTVACEIYYKYGMFLAPLSASLITAKHLKSLSPTDNKSDGDGRATDGECTTGKRDGEPTKDSDENSD